MSDWRNSARIRLWRYKTIVTYYLTTFFHICPQPCERDDNHHRAICDFRYTGMAEPEGVQGGGYAPPPPQCDELKLRWLLYMHARVCPEIYFWSNCWIIFDISNIRSWLGFAKKHIWNIINEIVFRNCNFLLISKSISSIMFQICIWANPSWDLVFDISKSIQNINQKYIAGHVLACT